MEFVVLPAYRRKGYGREMYLRLEQFIQARRRKTNVS